ncbi:ethanolamine kinase 2-like [Tigriopus californicus]|uniref:ethanolamine kinase 2-like n=1 Tax=Tigriopus californicus TaxID=6832 RepID=UPI0027DA3C15|nr:ethanolamine kinase 2-like [Tigriopus californicus]XP_059078370.1 ethanolamine kinase 2-like [Tigriopus californicus]XP_059078371.1 ethanolamine kinase 2-like [Tigriopus californicus]XP_059078372.1 ethanolamine kinase 2-like [Tigriopus californicus]
MSPNADLRGRAITQLPDFVVDFQSEESLHVGAKALVSQLKPEWPLDELRIKKFSEGITNVLVGVYRVPNKRDMIMVRCYGNHTETMIDRQAEIRNMLAFYDAGCGARLYGTFANGVAYAFITGTMLTTELVVQPKVNQLVLEMMARMHHFNDHQDPAERQPCLWKLMRTFWRLVPDQYDDPKKARRFQELGLFSRSELKREIDVFEALLGDCDSPVVFCHNDLLLGNVILSEDQSQVRFIDYEYGDNNYQAYDIANHFTEYVGVGDHLDYQRLYPKEPEQKDWIKRYLQAYHATAEISEDYVHRTYVLVNKFSLLANFTWAMWSLVQAQLSSIDFDYFDYAKQRFDEFKRQKPVFLALE